MLSESEIKEMSTWSGLPPSTATNSLPTRHCYQKLPIWLWVDLVLLMVAVAALIAYRDCKEAHREGFRVDSIQISPDGGISFPVSCDHATAGGGWTIIQRRKTWTLNFNQNWKQYRVGFGHLNGSHWLGNENIRRLTMKRDQELLVILHTDGGVYNATYRPFMVGPAIEFYRLFAGQYWKGNAGNGLSDNNEMVFSTADTHYNTSTEGSCSAISKSGWWFRVRCGSNLNAPKDLGMTWKSLGNAKVLHPKQSRMMIRQF